MKDATDYKELFRGILDPSEIRAMSPAELLREIDGQTELDLEGYTDFVSKILESDLPKGISGHHIVTIDPDVDPVYFLVMRSDPALKSPLIIESGFPNVDNLVGLFNAEKLKGWATRFGLKATGKKQAIAEKLVAAGVDVGFRRCRINPDAALEQHGQLSQRYIDEIRSISDSLLPEYRQALWSEVTLQHELSDHALNQARQALVELETEMPRKAIQSAPRPIAMASNSRPKPTRHEPQTDLSHGYYSPPSIPESHDGVIGWLRRLFGGAR